MRVLVIALSAVLLAGCASKHLNTQERRSVQQSCAKKVGVDSTLSQAFNKDYKRCLDEEAKGILVPRFQETCAANLRDKSHPLLERCMEDLPNLSRDSRRCFDLWQYESEPYRLCVSQLDVARFDQERRCATEGLKLGTPDFGVCINRLESARIAANEAAARRRGVDDLRVSKDQLERYKSDMELCRALSNPSLCPR